MTVILSAVEGSVPLPGFTRVNTLGAPPGRGFRDRGGAFDGPRLASSAAKPWFSQRIHHVLPRILYPSTCILMTPKSKASNGGAGAAVIETSNGSNLERERVFQAYRQFGYLEGDLDPLGFLRPREAPELEREGEYAREARAIYSSTIGVEINHIYAPERRRWIYEQMESPSQGFEVTEDVQARILDLLIRADVFEQVMQQRYL